MIIMKGDVLDIRGLTKAESILFADAGAYSYVESGIVDNELRVYGNWQTAEQPGQRAWFITWKQGTEIPQELGDWLVAHQGFEDLEAKVLIVKRGNFDSPIDGAFEKGWIAGIFECGEILSRPLSNQCDVCGGTGVICACDTLLNISDEPCPACRPPLID